MTLLEQNVTIANDVELSELYERAAGADVVTHSQIVDGRAYSQARRLRSQVLLEYKGNR